MHARPITTTTFGALHRTVAVSCLLLGCGSAAALEPSAATGEASGAAVPADGPCTSGAGATVLAQGIARGIAVDDAFVYTARNEGLVRVPRAGGVVESLVVSESPVGLAADATSLYYFGHVAGTTADAQGKVPSGGAALFALPRAGGAARVLVDGAYGTTMVSDGTTLTWDGVGAVNQVALADGSASTTSLELGEVVEAMALGRDAIFLAVYRLGVGGSAASGSIRRMPRGGGAVTTVVSGLSHPSALALDESHVYFVDARASGDTVVESARLDGSDRKTLVTAQATSLAVDAHAVYYATQTSIAKVDLSSGAITEVVGGLEAPGNVALRGGNVYWANATTVAFSAKDPPYAVMTACK